MPKGSISGAERLHPPFDAELSGGRAGAERAADHTGGRRDREDQSRALLAHHRQHGTGHVHGAEQQGLDLGANLIRAELLEEAGVEVSRVVHQHVDAAEPCDGGRSRGFRVIRASDVELYGQKLVVRADRRRQLCGVAARGDDRVSRGQGGFDNVHAQTAAGTGDEPNLLLRHSPLPALKRGDCRQLNQREKPPDASCLMKAYFIANSPPRVSGCGVRSRRTTLGKFNQRLQFRRLAASAGVVKIEARKGRRERCQNALQPLRLEVRRNELRDKLVSRTISRTDFFSRKCIRRTLPIMAMVITPSPLLKKEAG